MKGPMKSLLRSLRVTPASLALASFLGLGAAQAAAPSVAAAAETETRAFEVLVGSDKVGSSKLIITKQDDGTTLVKNEADVKVQILWVKVTYWTREYEIWKGFTLTRLAANTYDDGDKRSVEVTTEGNALKVKKTGKETKEATVATPVWTTTYWSLPPTDARGEAQHLLDADSGKEMSGKLRFVSKEACTVAGKAAQCNHYRMKTDEDIDLWFDESDRLVRRETTKMGKKVAVVVTSITKS
jgi:hypothetical protein